MDSATVGILGGVVLIVLLMLGLHVAIALAAVGIVGLAVLVGISAALGFVATTPYSEVAVFSFSVLPMFLLMGEFALQAGIGQELYEAASRWLGKLPGGLAIATTVSIAVFSAASGSSVATAAMFTRLALPEMLRFGYHPRLAAGSIAAGGTLDIMIPPSGMMVIYGIFTEQSIGKLLIAGVLPGLILAVSYVVGIYLVVRRNPKLAPPVPGHFSLKEKVSAIRWLVPLVILVILVLGAIYFGVATPTEAGAIGAFGAFLLFLIRRRFTPRRFGDTLIATTLTTSMVFLIVAGAFIFSRFMAITGITSALATYFMHLAVAPWVVVALFMLVYLVLGCFLDVVAMYALTLPLFFPVVKALGVDGIWFGVMVTLMTEVAFITPPLGMTIYVVKGAAGDAVRMEDIFVGALYPFLICDVIVLALLFVFPQIALWLPTMMLGK